MTSAIPGEVRETRSVVIFRNWITNYVLENKFISDYKNGDTNASLLLWNFISHYGLENTVAKTQDGTTISMDGWMYGWILFGLDSHRAPSIFSF